MQSLPGSSTGNALGPALPSFKIRHALIFCTLNVAWLCVEFGVFILLIVDMVLYRLYC